jgi:hypothetical protein
VPFLVDQVLVHPDLEGDQVQALGEPTELGGDASVVLLEERETFLLVARARTNKVGIAAERGQRHAGGAKDDADGQPVDVVLAVATTPAGTTTDRADEDTLLLVEAERVHAQTGALGDLPDAQTRGVVSHAEQGNEG